MRVVVTGGGSIGAARLGTVRAGAGAPRLSRPGSARRVPDARILSWRRIGAVLAILPLMTVPAAADCFDWSRPGVVTTDGAMRGLPPGAVRWRIGRTSAAGSRIETTVEIHWRGPGGRERRQVLFDGMQDGRVHLSAHGNRLSLHMTLCSQEQPSCQDLVVPYAWDAATGLFAGRTAQAEQFMAAACQPAAAPTPPIRTPPAR